MPDGPRYEDDFYRWTQYQAEVLRRLETRDNRFDREHLAEEIEDLGRSQRDAVRRQVRRILLHFHSTATDPRAGWMNSVDDARAEIEDKLTPSLRRDLELVLPRLYASARRPALRDLREYGERTSVQSLPPECPYTLEQVFADDWYPAPAVPNTSLDQENTG